MMLLVLKEKGGYYKVPIRSKRSYHAVPLYSETAYDKKDRSAQRGFDDLFGFGVGKVEVPATEFLRELGCFAS